MKFIETPLRGAYVIELEKRQDPRGFFARLFCTKELAACGINFQVQQANNSRSEERHTLRGMHYQLPPQAETKLIRCIHGEIYDLILDLRVDSPTFGKSFGAELTELNRKMMLVPKGFAHGFLTLSDASEVIYLVDEFYSSELERGIRWNDPQFELNWPAEPKVISERDSKHPDFNSGWNLGA